MPLNISKKIRLIRFHSNENESIAYLLYLGSSEAAFCQGKQPETSYLICLNVFGANYIVLIFPREFRE